MINYSIRYSNNRKTVGIKVTKNLTVEVLAPQNLSAEYIDSIVQKNLHWIKSSLEKQSAINAAHPEPDMDESIKLRNKALDELPSRTMYFSNIMKLYPSSIKITSAKTRFGSCSSKNGICFSWRLMQYPQKAIDYVIVHELAHIAYKNHGPDFYKLICSFMPDYKERRALLKT